MEEKEEIEVVKAKSMRASTNKMEPAEVDVVEEIERVVTDLQKPLRMHKKKLRKNQSLRKRRSLNLNMKKSFLAKILMISLEPSRLLVAESKPEKLRRLMEQLRRKKQKKRDKLLFNKMHTRRMLVNLEEQALTTFI